MCKLLGLQYGIHYKKGCDNVVADALSRRPGLHHEGSAMAVTEVILSYRNYKPATRVMSRPLISCKVR
jgi:hypothetical protein